MRSATAKHEPSQGFLESSGQVGLELPEQFYPDNKDIDNERPNHRNQLTRRNAQTRKARGIDCVHHLSPPPNRCNQNHTMRQDISHRRHDIGPTISELQDSTPHASHQARCLRKTAFATHAQADAPVLAASRIAGLQIKIKL